MTLSRPWTNGDRVDLLLPMPLSAIGGVNNSISISRGPLVFSLKMPEQKKPLKPDSNGFVPLENFSPDPWNFALNVEPAHVASAIRVRKAPLPAGSPFQPDASPVTLIVSGKRIPSWGMNWTGRSVEEPPVSPLSSDEPDQKVTLGAARRTDAPRNRFPLARPAGEAGRRIPLRFSRQRCTRLGDLRR